MGTHYSNWQFEMGILYGLSADTRAGAILFCADHLVLKRHALRVVFLKPCLSSDLARNDPQVIAVANLLAGST